MSRVSARHILKIIFHNMELTSANVEKTFKECLFKRGENTSNYIEAHAITIRIGFHPQRIEEKRKDIDDMLLQLHGNFMESQGGGWTFLNACLNKDGKQWTGEHQTMDCLLALGLAIKKVEFQLARELWQSLPGGMPFFFVKDKSK